MLIKYIALCSNDAIIAKASFGKDNYTHVAEEILSQNSEFPSLLTKKTDFGVFYCITASQSILRMVCCTNESDESLILRKAEQIFESFLQKYSENVTDKDVEQYLANHLGIIHFDAHSMTKNLELEGPLLENQEGHPLEDLQSTTQLKPQRLNIHVRRTACFEKIAPWAVTIAVAAALTIVIISIACGGVLLPNCV